MAFATVVTEPTAIPQGIRATVDDRHTLVVQILGDRLGRVRLTPGAHPLVDRTWMIAPEGDTPWAGRDRGSVEGFDNPPVTVTIASEGDSHGAVSQPIRDIVSTGSHADAVVAVVESAHLRVVISHRPLRLEWFVSLPEGEADGWVPLVRDRATGAYLLSGTGAVEHFQDRPQGHRYWGLGTRSGDLERTGRRFDLRALDAMGYDAERTDPLYGHVPFTITTGAPLPFGMLYDNLAAGTLDLGLEVDNYHAPYRRYRAECGDLDYHLFAEERLDDVTRTAVRLTGGVAFPPRWSLGYSGSTMAYTDAPDASARLGGFIDGCERHDIPCDSFQLSSGYTSIGDKRYVFTWNRDKFPDPAATAAQFVRAGMPLVANVKPCLLHDHPEYGSLRDRGAFAYLPASDGTPASPELSYFWGDVGSHLDFTNPVARDWWAERVRTRLLGMGVAATWNDNNEYEVWDDDVMCAGDGSPVPMRAVRPLHALLMCRTSRDAQLAHSPGLRPYLITRSGPLGLQRYAQTWSGDNRTDWNSLRYNVRMGVGMSMSGLLNFGHDAGGFAGPQPDAELLVRWVQSCALLPRFTIHSWNDDGTVTEPWSHPEATDHVRTALRLRYELLPHLYTLLWLAHESHEPIVRPRFAAFPHDPAAYDECDDFLVSDELLVAPVTVPGATRREVYLPRPAPGDLHGHGWFDRAEGTWHAPGTVATVDAPLHRLPLFVRAGGGVLTTGASAAPRAGSLHGSGAQAEAARELELWPAPAGRGVVTTSGVAFEDDGVSFGYRQGGCRVFRWEMTSTGARITVSVAAEGDLVPPWGPLRVRLPAGESRPVILEAHPDVAVLA